MNFKLSNLLDCLVRATDGDAGMVQQFYFDDLTWMIRYMTIKLKGGQPNRNVLIPLAALGNPDWDKQVMTINLTINQVLSSPDTDIDEPVSREHEVALYNYYAWPGYWGGSFYIPFGYDVTSFPIRNPETTAKTPPPGVRKGNPHLRSIREAQGCHVHAIDAVIGNVEDFIVDDETWAIRYLVVNTKKWLRNKNILVSPHWISKVSWSDRQVFVDLEQEAVKNSPKYDPSIPFSSIYEGQLRDHLQKPEPKEWVQFKFHAPPRTKVYVAGTFNNWDPTAMKLGYHGKGTYSTMVLLPLGMYEYKFIVNGEWRNSPDYCGEQVPNAFGTTNSKLVVSRKTVHDIHAHTFSRMPESESHRLWGAST